MLSPASILRVPKHVTAFYRAHHEHCHLLVPRSSVSCALPRWPHCTPDRRTPRKEITVLHDQPKSTANSGCTRSTILPWRLSTKPTTAQSTGFSTAGICHQSTRSTVSYDGVLLLHEPPVTSISSITAALHSAHLTRAIYRW